MKHVVMTRSAYGRAWTEDANRRRLEITRGVTVASMAAQTSKDWTWLVALDKNDPLREERRQVFLSAGVTVKFLNIDTDGADPATSAVMGYQAPWHRLIGKRDQPVAMTRLDDDDALAPWAMERIGQYAERSAKRRTALILPHGVRVWGGRVTLVRHASNAMQTLVTPAGDDLHVYAYGHRDVKRVARVRVIDGNLAWVWSRHPDTISGWKVAERPITDRVRVMFPIDWTLLETPARNAGGPLGRFFR